MEASGFRKPGKEFELTNEELLAAPARMLSKAQRAKRRALKRKMYADRSKARRRARREGMEAKLNHCQGYTKRGDPCASPVVNGAKHCRFHLNDAELAKLGKKPMGQINSERVRPRDRVPGPVLMREVTEVAVEKLVHRYFLALGLEFVGFDPEGNPVVMDHGVKKGICIHGESKDGYVEMSEYPDMVAQIQVMEKLFDRVYGRPKQTQVLEGGIKPIQMQPVRTVERAQGMATLLQRSGALPAPVIEGEAREVEPPRPGPVDNEDGVA